MVAASATCRLFFVLVVTMFISAQGNQLVRKERAVLLADGTISRESDSDHDIEKQKEETCEDISAKFAASPDHNKVTLCAAFVANGANPPCCDTDDCCVDGNHCKLEEVYAALEMDCQGSLLQRKQRKHKKRRGWHGNTPSETAMSCSEIETDFHKDEPVASQRLCSDITKDQGEAGVAVSPPSCCPMSCCASDVCTLAELYTALNRCDDCGCTAGLDCEGIRAKYNRDGHSVNTFCQDAMSVGHMNSGNLPCCAQKPYTCCADPEQCTLQEIDTAVHESCPNSLLDVGQRKKHKRHPGIVLGVTCEDVTNIYQSSNKDHEAVCTQMQANGANPHCCLVGNCCTNSESCRLQEVYAALGMSCQHAPMEGLMQNGVKGGMTCDMVTSRYNSQSHDVFNICQDIQSQGANPACCESQTCCMDKLECQLDEVHKALGMSC